MQTDVVADYEQLRTIQQAFYDEAEHIEQVLSTLNKQKEKLHGGEWQSSGASRFYDSMEDTTLPSMKRLHIALNNSGQLTGQIIIIFSEAEGLCVGDLKFQTLQNLDNSTSTIKDATEMFLGKILPSLLTNKGFDWITAEYAEFIIKDGDDFLKLIKQYEILEAAKKAGLSDAIIPGVLSGLLDYAIGATQGKPTDGWELGAQIVSGLIQGTMALTPIGQGIFAANAVIQISLLGIEGAANISSSFGFEKGDAISSWASTLRETASIDNLIDDLARGNFDETSTWAIDVFKATFDIDEIYGY